MTRLQNGIMALTLLATASGGALAQTTSSEAPASLPPPKTATPSVAPAAPSVTPAAPSPPLIVRVEQVAPIKLESTKESSWWARVAPFIASVISGFIAFIGVLLGLKVGETNTQRTIEAAQRNSDAAINQKANEAELKAIQDKLDAFYGPYLQRSEESRLLASELRDRQPNKETFRTLLKLLDPAWFPALSKADQTIVNEIVENGDKLRTLIRDKAGAVDPAILPYLARAGTHFTMLKLAKANALMNDPARFALYVYPGQLDKVLNTDMTRLKQRIETLQSRPSERHGLLGPLVIPNDLALTPWPDPPRQ